MSETTYSMTKVKLNDKVKEYLVQHGERKLYKKGEFVFKEGDESDFIYIILSGSCEVFTADEKGSLVSLDTLDEGSIFGEMGLFLKNKRSASVRAIDDIDMTAFSKQKFLQTISNVPAFNLNVLNILVSRLYQMNKRYVNVVNFRIMSALCTYLKFEICDKNIANPIKVDSKSVSAKIGVSVNEYFKALIALEKSAIVSNLNIRDDMSSIFVLNCRALEEYIIKSAYERI